MGKYICKRCGAEYSILPQGGCSTPGCHNTNYALFEYRETQSDHEIPPPPPFDNGRKKKQKKKEKPPKPVKKKKQSDSEPPSPPLPDDRRQRIRSANELFKQDTAQSLKQALDIYRSLGNYKNAAKRAKKCEKLLREMNVPVIPQDTVPKKKHGLRNAIIIILSLLIVAAAVVFGVLPFFGYDLLPFGFFDMSRGKAMQLEIEIPDNVPYYEQIQIVEWESDDTFVLKEDTVKNLSKDGKTVYQTEIHGDERVDVFFGETNVYSYSLKYAMKQVEMTEKRNAYQPPEPTVSVQYYRSMDRYSRENPTLVIYETDTAPVIKTGVAFSGASDEDAQRFLTNMEEILIVVTFQDGTTKSYSGKINPEKKITNKTVEFYSELLDFPNRAGTMKVEVYDAEHHVLGSSEIRVR